VDGVVYWLELAVGDMRSVDYWLELAVGDKRSVVYWLELAVGDVWTTWYTDNNITLKMTALAAETRW